MSIYATGWTIRLQMDPPFSIRWGLGESPNWYFAEIYVQFVPGHIGHPDEGYKTDPYATDPYADFLPPVVEDSEDTRAAVILLKGFDKKEGQRYVSPLMTLSGKEYNDAKFGDLVGRIFRRAREMLVESGVLHKHPWVVQQLISEGK